MNRWALMMAIALPLGVGAPAVRAGAEDAASVQRGEGAGGSAAGETRTASSPQDPTVMIAAMPVFVPPNRGSPLARLGGATRSAGNHDLPRIEALVPEETGWTLRESPVLHWYLADTTDVRIDLVVLRLDPPETLLETTLPKAGRAGVQRIDLADHGIKLAADQSYQWLVKLVPNPEDRSYDRVVGGGLRRVEPSPELSQQLADPQASRPHVLAKAGIWYDAVDELSRQIEAAPGNRTLWNQRAALFEQVGLPELDLEEGAAPAFGKR